MDFQLLQTLIDWARLHPAWAGAAIFLVAFLESVALLGLFVPGAVLLLAIGALAALDAFPVSRALACAMLGAMAGDGLSFWLGRHYHQHLREIWPFSRYPALFARGEAFFTAHGGKSLLIGRFVGPVRPIIPALAGMMNMPVGRYLAINLLASLAWAPAYILPGVALGASLELASEVTGRLVVLAVMLLALVWLGAWGIRCGYRFLAPRAGSLAERGMRWIGRHPRGGRMLAAVIDPEAPEPRGLLLWALLLACATGGLAVLLVEISGGVLLPLDHGVWQLMQAMRSPWADRLMILVTELGDGAVSVTLGAAVLAWLLWRRHWLAALHLGAALAFALTVPALLKQALQLPRPVDLSGDAFRYGFPSWHATMNAVLYGFLAVLLARGLPEPRRWLIYAAAGNLILLIAFTRVYLGAHWLSDVLGGLALGLAWVAVLGIAYRRHARVALPRLQLLVILALVWAVVWPWHASQRHEQDLARYAPPAEIRHWDAREWWQSGWRSLPAFRQDMRGEYEQAFTLQWLARPGEIEAALETQGWRAPPPLAGASALRWLMPAPEMTSLPVLPQLHDGHHEALLRVRATGEADRLQVLRLWSAGVEAGDRNTPVWIGYAGYLRLTRPLGFLSLPRAGAETADAGEILGAAPDGFDWRLVEPALAAAMPEHRGLWLIRPREDAR